MKPESEAYNIDCLDYMMNISDQLFDLAIVDPPYGIGRDWKKDKASSFYHHNLTYSNNAIPEDAYFKELFRVSRQQIIWGGNYFTEHLPPSNSWIVWDKGIDYKTQHKSEGELAWTSFNNPLRIVRRLWCGCATCEARSKIHPHEKPISLYTWVLKNYATRGDKIFDSHLGSGSSRIAAYMLGYDFYGCEIDKGFFNAQENRFKKACSGEVIINNVTIKQLTIDI
ncbi:MAG: site-specific DNA-methyltransferase [Prevotellaceae bacterium]|jgi:site-specific DNA-methyltransferase (adenine-specific)|nr:site-specific DNA-methyltransferase [Prevotellaceae bacterium]